MAIDGSAPPRPAMSTPLGHLLALALAFAAAEHAPPRTPTIGRGSRSWTRMATV